MKIMLVAWNDELSLGYDVIDSGHKLVIEAINRLNACGAAEARHVVATSLRMLQDHLPKQFHHEETLMMIAGSPHLPAQRAEHSCFLAALKALNTSFDNGENVLNLLLLNLVAFLKGHLRGSDLEEFLPQMLRAA